MRNIHPWVVILDFCDLGAGPKACPCHLLYSIALLYTVQYQIVPYCFGLFFTLLYYTLLYCIVLYCFVLFCTVL